MISCCRNERIYKTEEVKFKISNGVDKLDKWLEKKEFNGA